MGKSLDELASYFRPIAEGILSDATDAGLDPVIEDTGRTEPEQAVKIATNVSWTTTSKHLPQPPEGKSEAIDIVPRVCISLKYWGWTGEVGTSHPYWGKLIEIGRKRGARCGVDFPHPDPGHFQWISGVETA
jgi:hypothetical protein